MSSPLAASLYQEQVRRATPHAEVDRALADLQRGRRRWGAMALAEKIALAERCAAGVFAVAEEWAAAGCRAKELDPRAPEAAEEILAGPVATLRYLRLILGSLTDVARHGAPRLPGPLTRTITGQVAAPVMPTRLLYDSLLFRGFRAAVWMSPAVPPDIRPADLAAWGRSAPAANGATLVLGAGNVSSIAATDVLSKLFAEGRVVLLKMNPVNDYLGDIFARAFAPLVAADCLRIVYGGAEVGQYAVAHPDVVDVHVTGSIHTHEALVWGPPGPDRDRRKAAGEPLLHKRITSELGNVTPWIIVPGAYTPRQLAFQAENLAAMIVNNASFNCIAPKVIVTCRQWPQREHFLNQLAAVLASVPPRRAYYPGAAERFARFAGEHAPHNFDAARPPWLVVRDVDPDRQPRFCDEESFTCVLAETALNADDAAGFLPRAVEFANDRLWGTLGAGLMIADSTRRQPQAEAALQRAIATLRYGTVAVNHWPGLSFALMSTPWGGFPGGTLADPQSGVGWVHNTYFLEPAEKTVLEGPLTAWPKPVWFPTHRGAQHVARSLLRLYAAPGLGKLPGLAWRSLWS